MRLTDNNIKRMKSLDKIINKNNMHEIIHKCYFYKNYVFIVNTGQTIGKIKIDTFNNLKEGI